MAAKVIAMEQLKQVLHLAQQGQSIKGIARLTGLARNTVRTYLARGLEQGSDPAVHTDAQLAAQLYDQDTSDFKSSRYQQLLQHLESADTELVKTGVTRQLLCGSIWSNTRMAMATASTAITCNSYWLKRT